MQFLGKTIRVLVLSMFMVYGSEYVFPFLNAVSSFNCQLINCFSYYYAFPTGESRDFYNPSQDFFNPSSQDFYNPSSQDLSYLQFFGLDRSFAPRNPRYLPPHSYRKEFINGRSSQEGESYSNYSPGMEVEEIMHYSLSLLYKGRSKKNVFLGDLSQIYLPTHPPQSFCEIWENKR